MNEWVFWTIVNDGKRCSWYINGEFLRDYDPFGQPNAAPLRIGRSGDCGGFEGLIEDFRIYNRAMTGKEIKAMYRYFNAADRQAAARP